MANQNSPIELLTEHYKKVLGAVITDTNTKAFQLNEGDISAIEKDCVDWIKALKGILVVKETILGVVNTAPDDGSVAESSNDPEITYTKSWETTEEKEELI